MSLKIVLLITLPVYSAILTIYNLVKNKRPNSSDQQSEATRVLASVIQLGALFICCFCVVYFIDDYFFSKNFENLKLDIQQFTSVPQSKQNIVDRFPSVPVEQIDSYLDEMILSGHIDRNKEFRDSKSMYVFEAIKYGPDVGSP